MAAHAEWAAAGARLQGEGRGMDCNVMRDTSRRAAGLLGGVLVLILCAVGSAAAGAEVGVRLGWADNGDEIFERSGDLGGTDLVGIHLGFDLLPILRAEVAGEYVSEPFEFSDGLLDGIEAAGSGDYEDLSLWVSGRAELFSLMMLPIKGYLGGGLNVHFVDLQIDEDLERLDAGSLTRLRATGAWDDELQDAVENVAGEQTQTGWHLLAGARLSLSGIPISVFVEGRYSDGFGEELPAAKSLYGGVSIQL
ncbi:MAG: hypothetical protein GF330_04735 [Candidatus Eisenbacteria bacterium]|nr:hypothetical protein [Candidatus Eisenbacteria bacterium]